MKKRIPIAAFVAALFLLANTSKAQTFLNFTVNEPPQLVADAGPDDVVCDGDSIQLGGAPTASGGTMAYTYTWSGTNLINNTVANPVALPTTTGDYIVTVTDARNCTAFDTISITVDTCVGLPDPRIDVTLSIYPNPSDGNFKLVLDGTHTDAAFSARVFDATGKLVVTRQLGLLETRLEDRFELNYLSRGVYTVEVRAGSHRFVRNIVIR